MRGSRIFLPYVFLTFEGLSSMARTHVLIQLIAVFALPVFFGSCDKTTNPVGSGLPVIPGEAVDHAAADLSRIPQQWIDAAKANLVIAYGHTSHGSQIVTGMSGLVAFAGDQYAFNATGSGGALQLIDSPFAGASDLGNPDWIAWESATRAYLAQHREVNVVIWSWCGQVSTATESNIDTYLALMSGLERDYPAVRFVYMTGHLDGTGTTGNLHQRNEQIRQYCIQNQKILYDFADIESYDPDETYFGNWRPNDNCDYDSNLDGTWDGNWAVEWQAAHPGEWYACSAAHSQPLNANRKAYAAWWLWATLAGWDGR
jgi:hypothetical protein